MTVAHFAFLCLLGQLFRLSSSCLPVYVSDFDKEDIRPGQVNADFLPKDVDADLLAATRAEDSECGCGVVSRNIVLDDLNIKNMGKVDLVSQYPWLVLIEFVGSDKQCAGTIINDLFVLTNAQCFIELTDSMSPLEVWSTTSENLPVDEIRISTGIKNPIKQHYVESEALFAEEVIIHPNFTLSYFIDRIIDYDFALIKLKTKLNLTEVTPICLPTKPLDYSDKDAIAIGWGDKIDHILGAPEFYEDYDLRHFRNLDIYFQDPDSRCSEFVNRKRMRCMTVMLPYIGMSGYGGPIMIKTEEVDEQGSSRSGPTRYRIYQTGIISYHRPSNVLNVVTKVSSILPFVDYFSTKEGATWCSSTKGSKPYFPWDIETHSTRMEKLNCGLRPTTTRIYGGCGTRAGILDGGKFHFNLGNNFEFQQPGYPWPPPTARIQGGVNSKLIQNWYPWTIYISARQLEWGTVPEYITTPEKRLIVCTGSLISDKLILTTTSCLFQEAEGWEGYKFSVDQIDDIPTVAHLVAYEDNINDTLITVDTEFYYENFQGRNKDFLKSGYRRLNITNAYLFPDFVQRRVSIFAESYLEDDIALLELREALHFPVDAKGTGPFHNLICLPKIEDSDYGIDKIENTLNKADAIVLTGYGKSDARETLINVAESEEYDASVGVDKLAKWFPGWMDTREKLISTQTLLGEVKNPGFSKYLQAANIRIRSLKDCQGFTESTVSTKFLCSNGSDSSKNQSAPNNFKFLAVTPLVGDEGAPLAVAKIQRGTKDSKFTQFGIASYSMREVEVKKKSKPGNINQYPALYLKIKEYIPWIEFVSNKIGAQYCAT